MRFSGLEFTVLYFAYSFSNAQEGGFGVDHSVSKWTTITITQPATTFTETGGTFTAVAETVEVGGQDPYAGEDFPGITHPTSFSFTTNSPTVLTEIATTETQAAAVETLILPPADLAEEILPDFLFLMKDVAPDVTDLPISVASRLNVDYTSLYGSYTSAHPMPTIFSKVNQDIASLYNSPDTKIQALAASINNNLFPFPDATESASIASALSSLLSPYPSLSSEIAAYQTAMNTWEAPEIIAVVSMIRTDLSITTPAPSWLSLASAYLPGATATSTHNGALPTRGASVIVNAGLAAAGMAVIGLL